MRKLLIFVCLIAAIGVQAQDVFTFAVNEIATVTDTSSIVYEDSSDKVVWNTNKDIPKSSFNIQGTEYKVLKLIATGEDNEGYSFAAYRVERNSGKISTVKVRVVGNGFVYPVQIYLIEDNGDYIIMNCTKQ